MLTSHVVKASLASAQTATLHGPLRHTLRPPKSNNGASMHRNINHVRKGRANRGISNRHGVVMLASADTDDSTGGTPPSIESSTNPPAQIITSSPSPQSARSEYHSPNTTNISFKKRVEAAANALRSGRASQTRRKPPETVPPVKGSGTRQAAAVPTTRSRSAPPTSPASRSNRTVSDTPLTNSLIEQSENAEQMAASQRRLFEQMVTLRTRLNERLAASNKFAKFLESTLQARDKDIKHANERLVAAMLEVESLQKIAIDAVEAAEDDTQSRENISARLATLTRRLDLMQKALRRDVKDIDAACIKSVPIRWVGMASDIRIMGSFDNWTKGVAMSPEFIEGGNNVFVADMMLVSGTYEIKFVVDGVWQTAPEWATTGDGLDANNLLVVE